MPYNLRITFGASKPVQLDAIVQSRDSSKAEPLVHATATLLELGECHKFLSKPLELALQLLAAVWGRIVLPASPRGPLQVDLPICLYTASSSDSADVVGAESRQAKTP